MTGHAGPALPPVRPRSSVWRRWLRPSRWWLGIGLLGLLAPAGLLLWSPASRPPSPSLESPPARPRLEARGRVQAAAQSRVGTLSGGVVARLAVELGQPIEAGEEIARVRNSAAVEVLTAPISGSVASLLVQPGDTVAPGAILAVVADLRRLQVETTDVDEFLISRIHPGQSVRLTVEALDQRELRGVVRAVAPQPVVNAVGDEHYPVVIDLLGHPADLKPGMSVRASFEPED